jgi:hypothetical protein
MVAQVVRRLLMRRETLGENHMKSMVLVSLMLVSTAFAADKWEGHKKIEGYVHPEKTRGALVVDGLGDQAREAGDFRADECSVGCSQACVSLARRILNDCGGVPGPTPGPIQQGCIDTRLQATRIARTRSRSARRVRSPSARSIRSRSSSSAGKRRARPIVPTRAASACTAGRSRASRRCTRSIGIARARRPPRM